VKIILRVALLLGLVLSADGAHADETPFGGRGQVALSIEHLFGYFHDSATTKQGGIEDTVSQDTFALLGNVGVGYSIPRLAADVFVAPNLSLGLAGVLIHNSSDGGSTTAYEVAPRLGYTVHASSRLTVWPRVGLIYEHVSSNASSSGSSSNRSASTTALTVDLALVIRMLGSTAFVIAPFADLGIGGSQDLSGALAASIDEKITELGLQFGFLMFF
jgi:hypothetical protein